MSKQGIVTSGEVIFSTMTEHDVYNGKSTGNYCLTVALSDQEARKLGDMGVQIKEYTHKETGETTLQRKFKSKFDVSVVDTDNNPVSGEIPFGSKVRVLWVAGDPSDQYGVPTYMNKVRVTEFSESVTEVPEEF